VLTVDTPIVKPEVVFIEQLLDDISLGKIRIPNFQRPFVWKPSDMLELFDSIYKGYPIGSLLFWESTEQLMTRPEVGPMQVPDRETRPLAYILDGQQRLATLFGTLRLPKEAAKGPKQDEWCWWIWFDLKEQVFLHIPRMESSAPEAWLIPLRSILKTVDFLEEARRIQAECPDEAPGFIEEAERLAQKLKNYKLAITTIQGGRLDQAVQIFSRLNSLGQRVTPDQMVSALTYREDGETQPLANHIDDILERLSDYHFGNIRRMTVFRAILAAAGKDVHRSEWEEIARSLGSDLPGAAEKAKDALWGATRFLYEELGVPGDRLLPYNNQLLLLSEFFCHCPEPSSQQNETLKKWFWLSSLSSWLASVNPTQLNLALKDMREFATNARQELPLQSFEALVRPFPNSYDLRSARVRALLIFMLTLKPLNPDDGAPVENEQILHELDQRGLPEMFYRPPQRALASSPANRLLVGRNAKRSVRERLRSFPEERRSHVLQSHGISLEAYQALRQNKAQDFIEDRANTLAQLEGSFIRQLGIRPPSGIGDGEADIDTDEGLS
jgi:hypothetical protein